MLKLQMQPFRMIAKAGVKLLFLLQPQARILQNWYEIVNFYKVRRNLLIAILQVQTLMSQNCQQFATLQRQMQPFRTKWILNVKNTEAY